MNAYHLFTVYKGLPAVRGAALFIFFSKITCIKGNHPVYYEVL